MGGGWVDGFLGAGFQLELGNSVNTPQMFLNFVNVPKYPGY